MIRLARLVFSQRAAVLALTLTALACVPLTLRIAAPDAALTLLLPVILIGASAAFIVYAPSLSRTRAAWIFWLVGPIVLFIRVGELGASIFDDFGETLRLIAVLVLPSQTIAGNLGVIPAWLNAQAELWSEVIAFAGRAGAWMAALVQGASRDDLSARALYLSFGLWLLAGWACWRIRRRNDPIGGLLPTSFVVAFILNNSIQDRWPLWLHLAALLLLLAIMQLSQMIRRWRTERTDFSDSIPEDTLIGSVVIIIILLITAYTASVFSIKDMLDRFHERQNPPSSSIVASRGTGPASAGIRSGAASELQNSHLITAGPKLSDDLVMTISTGDLPPMQHAEEIQAPRYYWRGATYDAYTGRGWFNPTTAVTEVRPETDLVEAPPQGYRLIHGIVSLPGGITGVAYWTGALVRSNMPFDVVWRSQPLDEAAGSMPEALGDGDLIGAQISSTEVASTPSYTFDSLIPEASETQLRAAPAAYPAWVASRYLQLPPSVPERVLSLARDLTARGRTPYDRALAIETYLRGIHYSLDVPAPPSGRDAADFFLFDLKRGYCDYYATSMVVLARASGLPARLVTGFASGSYDPYFARYVITNRDSHAWAEIYFSGIGWIEFEPTASQPPPRREILGGQASAPGTRPPELKTWDILPRLDGRVLWPLLWLMPAAAALFLGSLAVDGVRLRGMQPAESTRRVYRRLRRWTGRLHENPSLGETAREYAAALGRHLESLSGRGRLARSFLQPIAEPVGELTGLYTESLFAPTPLTPAEGRRAIRLWATIRSRLVLLDLLLAIMHLSARWRTVPSRLPASRAG